MTRAKINRLSHKFRSPETKTEWENALASFLQTQKRRRPNSGLLDLESGAAAMIAFAPPNLFSASAGLPADGIDLVMRALDTTHTRVRDRTSALFQITFYNLAD